MLGGGAAANAANAVLVSGCGAGGVTCSAGGRGVCSFGGARRILSRTSLTAFQPGGDVGRVDVSGGASGCPVTGSLVLRGSMGL